MFSIKHGFIFASIVIVCLVISAGFRSSDTLAQIRISDTPVRVIIPTSTSRATEITLSTPTATATATEEQGVLLEAVANPGDINVRSAPDTSGTRLGALEAGRTYRVRGVYFNWFLFDYDNAESGRAWVYADLVRIIGDVSAVPAVDPFAEPTASSQEISATGTQESELQMPGGVETATAETRILAIPTQNDLSASGELVPTFTPPPNVVPRATSESNTDVALPDSNNILQDAYVSFSQDGIPPITPIALLFGFGLIGLVVGVMRRL